MSKSAPPPPPAPDPTITASAQGAANVQTATAQTALNNANTVTPYGSSTYSKTGYQKVTQPDGSVNYVPTYTNTQTLAPDQQRLLQQNENLGIYGNQIAGVAMGNAADSLSNPLTSDSFSPIQTSAGLQSSYNPGGAIQTSYGTGPALQYSYDSGGPVQKSVDYNLASTKANQSSTFANTADQVQGSLGNTDFTADRDAATNAILQRLAPTIASQNEGLQAQLANQGVTQNSSAWNAASLQNAQNNNDLYLGAIGTGDAEQQALYGEKLSSGQFANSAQQQEYDQALGRGQFANTANLNQAQYGLAATGQNNAAQLAAGNFANSAQAQQYGENEAGAGFFNQTVGQQNEQNAAQAAFGNAAQNQQNQQNAAGAGFYNQSQLAGAQFGNEAEQQQYAQGIGLNNQSINQVDALRSGGQVTSPNFQGYTAGTLDQTPLASSVYQTAGLNQAAYNTQAGLDAANTTALGSVLGGALGGLGYAAGGGFFGKPSDRRLKTDIRQIGTADNGLPIYLYRLHGSVTPEIGFMADEVARVRPEAVQRHESGFDFVDYRKAAA